MPDPFLGELRLFSFNFAPHGWALCNGQLLPINQNQALFSLLGTAFGGDGRQNFALPDLRGRTPIHIGGDSGWIHGQAGGEERHTLVASAMPAHWHAAFANSAPGTVASPAGGLLAQRRSETYHAPTSLVPMNPQALVSSGGNQAHANMQPYLVLTFCVSLTGSFPT